MSILKNISNGLLSAQMLEENHWLRLTTCYSQYINTEGTFGFHFSTFKKTMFVFHLANSCSSTSVSNSQYYSSPNSITGVYKDEIDVICQSGYEKGGTVICQSNGGFSTVTCEGNSIFFHMICTWFSHTQGTYWQLQWESIQVVNAERLFWGQAFEILSNRMWTYVCI